MDHKSSVNAKNRLFKILPKSFSALIFQRPACNPNDGPTRARQKIKNSSNLSAQEPTSPKISCMGQIKHKRKICKERHIPLPKDSSLKKIQKSSSILNLFGFGKQTSNGSHVYRGTKLGQVKKYSSDQNLFANFDWAVQIATVEYDCDGGDEDKDTVSLSVDILMKDRVYLKPRQEVNLWKRRTMAQPKPLKINTVVL